MFRNFKLSTIGLALMALPPAALADDFPPEVQGTYSHTETCQFDFLLTVGESSAHLKIGGDEMTMTDWDVCLSCAGGASYQGIQVMSFPKLGYDRDPVFTFNADEQAGKLTVEYHGQQPLSMELRALLENSPLQKCRS